MSMVIGPNFLVYFIVFGVADARFTVNEASNQPTFDSNEIVVSLSSLFHSFPLACVPVILSHTL
jgi:hypothetical protein